MDTPQDVIIKMANGNPGALTAMAEIIKISSLPDGLLAIMKLDELRIYGCNIYLIWNDLLKRNAGALLFLIESDDLKALIMEQYNNNESFKHEWNYSSGPTWKNVTK